MSVCLSLRRSLTQNGRKGYGSDWGRRRREKGKGRRGENRMNPLDFRTRMRRLCVITTSTIREGSTPFLVCVCAHQREQPRDRCVRNETQRYAVITSLVTHTLCVCVCVFGRENSAPHRCRLDHYCCVRRTAGVFPIKTEPSMLTYASSFTTGGGQRNSRNGYAPEMYYRTQNWALYNEQVALYRPIVLHRFGDNGCCLCRWRPLRLYAVICYRYKIYFRLYDVTAFALSYDG